MNKQTLVEKGLEYLQCEQEFLEDNINVLEEILSEYFTCGTCSQIYKESYKFIKGILKMLFIAMQKQLNDIEDHLEEFDNVD